MTRKEQIKEYLRVIGSGDMENIPFDVGFECGVEWADQNPSTETINRIIELYKHWYSSQCDIAVTDYIKQNY